MKKTENIPTELRQRAQWVGFKPIPQEGKKPIKMPINPSTGDEAKVNDSSTWTTFDQAIAGMKRFKYPWIGFVFTENDPFFGVDQDNVRDPATEIIEERALKIAEGLSTYTEISCSGTGCHHIGRGKLPGTGHKDEEKGLEVYDRGRAFVFTGDVIPDFPIAIESRQPELDAFLQEHFNGHSISKNQKKSRHVQIRTEILRLRNAGIPKEQALIAALNLAESLNTPGQRVINEKEVSGIVDWVYSRTAQEYLLTEGGLTDRFYDLFGNDIRYCYPTKSFYVFDGARYAIDRSGVVEGMAAEMIRSMYREATEILGEDARKAFVNHVKRSDSAKTITDLLKLLRNKVSVLPENFDNDPYLLNCRNGVLNLKTGELLPHDRNYLMTKLAPVDYDAAANLQLWNEFIETVTAKDSVKAGFLQRFAGSCLVGKQHDEKVPFVIGKDATGKTTFLEALRATLGDYAAVGNFETFMPRKYAEAPRHDIANFAGVRLIVVEEIPKGGKLDEHIFNRLTGGSRLRARQLHEREFEIEANYHVIFASNNPPKVRTDEPGTWRRILRVPFTNQIPESDRNPEIKNSLRTPEVAGPAILAWLVTGCLQWQKIGLQTPDEILKSTAEYKAECDPLKDFLEQECVLHPQAWTPTETLWNKYQDWLKSFNERGVKQRDFWTALREHGCFPEQLKTHDKPRGWRGIALLPWTPQESADTADTTSSTMRTLADSDFQLFSHGNDIEKDMENAVRTVRKCFFCKETWFYGYDICARCHPPVSPQQLFQLTEDGEKIHAEVQS